MSGYGAPADVQRGLDSGFDEYLVKPVDIAELQRVIARCRSRA
jgi:DNA-binding response OmpR family regulator